MKTISFVLAALLGITALPSSASSAFLELSDAIPDQEQPTTYSDYSPRRPLRGADCHVLWCAPGVEVSLLDELGRDFQPGMKKGYAHLRVDRRPTKVIVRNAHPYRVMVLFSVNHKNPLDGKKAMMASRGYVIPARGELAIDQVKIGNGSWFGSSWSQEGQITIHIHHETPYRPVEGGPPPHAPVDARTYIVENGKRYWVPPSWFPFRYLDAKRILPQEKMYLTYDIPNRSAPGN